MLSLYKQSLTFLLCFVFVCVPQLKTIAQNNTNRSVLIFDPNPTFVPPDREEVFRVFFPYTNPYNDKELKNVVAEIRIQGNGFQLDPENFIDYYSNSSNSRKDCSNVSDADGYRIGVTLANESSLVYGLQSANSPDRPTGSSVHSLNPGASGCLQVSIRVTDKAIVGQKSQLIMNWYSQDIDILEEQPPILQYNLEIKSNDNVGAVCDSGEVFENGQCVIQCQLGFVRNDLGVCVDQAVLNDTPERNVDERMSATNEFTSEDNSFQILLWLLWILCGLLVVSIGFMVIFIRNYMKYRKYYLTKAKKRLK